MTPGHAAMRARDGGGVAAVAMVGVAMVLTSLSQQHPASQELGFKSHVHVQSNS